jgi:hypothetical protein
LRWNDIVFDDKGGFWFTNLGKTYDRLMDRGAVYYAGVDGSMIKEAIYPIMTPERRRAVAGRAHALCLGNRDQPGLELNDHGRR